MMIREVSAGGHGSSARWLAVTDEFDLNTFVFFFFIVRVCIFLLVGHVSCKSNSLLSKFIS